MIRPLPQIAREARGLGLREALWLVQVARKDADMDALSALCRDRRVSVRKAAEYGLVASLVYEAAKDRERLATWWTTRMETSRRVGSDDVPRDLPDLYEHARSTFVKLLADKGVSEPERLWRKREHAFKVGLHMRADGIVRPRGPA